MNTTDQLVQPAANELPNWVPASEAELNVTEGGFGFGDVLRIVWQAVRNGGVVPPQA